MFLGPRAFSQESTFATRPLGTGVRADLRRQKVRVFRFFEKKGPKKWSNRKKNTKFGFYVP